MGFCFACFGPATEQRREEERLESQDARAKAAEAADKRQEQFEKSAAGRAMRAQLAANAKQTVSSNKSEPVLKVHSQSSRSRRQAIEQAFRRVADLGASCVEILLEFGQ